MKEVCHTLSIQYAARVLHFNQISLCNPVSKIKQLGPNYSLLIAFSDNPIELVTFKVYISTGLLVQNNIRDQSTVIRSNYMVLMGAPDIDSNIIVICKDTSYFNKYSAVDNMRGSPKMSIIFFPMGAVTISMFYVIRLWILSYALPESVFPWGVCFIFFLFGSYLATAL